MRRPYRGLSHGAQLARSSNSSRVTRRTTPALAQRTTEIISAVSAGLSSGGLERVLFDLALKDRQVTDFRSAYASKPM